MSSVTVVVTGFPEFISLNRIARGFEFLLNQHDIGRFRLWKIGKNSHKKSVGLDFDSGFDAISAQKVLDDYEFIFNDKSYVLNARTSLDPNHKPRMNDPDFETITAERKSHQDMHQSSALVPILPSHEAKAQEQQMTFQIKLLKKHTKLLEAERNYAREQRKLQREYLREVYSISDDSDSPSRKRSPSPRPKRSRRQSRKRTRSSSRKRSLRSPTKRRKSPRQRSPTPRSLTGSPSSLTPRSRTQSRRSPTKKRKSPRPRSSVTRSLTGSPRSPTPTPRTQSRRSTTPRRRTQSQTSPPPRSRTQSRKSLTKRRKSPTPRSLTGSSRSPTPRPKTQSRRSPTKSRKSPRPRSPAPRSVTLSPWSPTPTPRTQSRRSMTKRRKSPKPRSITGSPRSPTPRPRTQSRRSPTKRWESPRPRSPATRSLTGSQRSWAHSPRSPTGSPGSRSHSWRSSIESPRSPTPSPSSPTPRRPRPRSPIGCPRSPSPSPRLPTSRPRLRAVRPRSPIECSKSPTPSPRSPTPRPRSQALILRLPAQSPRSPTESPTSLTRISRSPTPRPSQSSRLRSPGRTPSPKSPRRTIGALPPSSHWSMRQIRSTISTPSTSRKRTTADICTKSTKKQCNKEQSKTNKMEKPIDTALCMKMEKIFDKAVQRIMSEIQLTVQNETTSDLSRILTTMSKIIKCRLRKMWSVGITDIELMLKYRNRYSKEVDLTLLRNIVQALISPYFIETQDDKTPQVDASSKSTWNAAHISDSGKWDMVSDDGQTEAFKEKNNVSEPDKNKIVCFIKPYNLKGLLYNKVPENPNFTIPRLVLMRQMKSLVNDMEAKCKYLYKITSLAIRDILKKIMKNRGYRATRKIIKLYRKKHPREKDEKFLKKMVKAINNGKYNEKCKELEDAENCGNLDESNDCIIVAEYKIVADSSIEAPKENIPNSDTSEKKQLYIDEKKAQVKRHISPESVDEKESTEAEQIKDNADVTLSAKDGETATNDDYEDYIKKFKHWLEVELVNVKHDGKD